MPTWKIAAVQMDCRIADRTHNLAAVRDRLREAAGNGARLVLLPECILSGYCFESKAEGLASAEPIPGPMTEALAADCRELGVFAVAGMLERDGDRLFNSAVLIGPRGLVGNYHKTHLPCLGIDKFTERGSGPYQVHDLDGLRVGMLICYDGSFPEPSRVLALQGADLIVLPTNWPTDGERAARISTPARALESRVYFAAINRVGEERGFRFIGLSQIIDVSGDHLAKADHANAAILYADIDPARARAKKIVNIPGEYEVDRVRDRRPELYGELVRKIV